MADKKFKSLEEELDYLSGEFQSISGMMEVRLQIVTDQLQDAMKLVKTAGENTR